MPFASCTLVGPEKHPVAKDNNRIWLFHFALHPLLPSSVVYPPLHLHFRYCVHYMIVSCYRSRTMPIQSNCTKGRIVVAAVIRKRPHRKIDFLSCTFNLCKIILQRSHPHRNCNLAKDLITHSSLSVALAHDQDLPKVFWQMVASPWYSNSTKGHITYSSLSVALANVQGLSKTFGQNTTSPIDFVCCSLHLSNIFTRVASPLQLLLGKRSHTLTTLILQRAASTLHCVYGQKAA